MKTKYIVLAACIGLVGYLIYQRITAESPQKNQPKGPRTTQVAIQVIQPEEFNPQLNLTGSLQGLEELNLRSEIAGVVERIAFTQGSYVQKGALLIELRSADIKAQLAQAKAKEALAKENHRRADLLLNKEAISREEYEIAFTEWKAAQAITQELNAQLAKTQIRAPFAGRLGLQQVELGSFISSQDIIVQLVNDSKVKLNFTVPEKYANQIKTGDVVQFSVNSAAKQQAKITAIEPALDANTRSLAVMAMAENPKKELLSGSFADIQLHVQAPTNALLIPSNAVIPVQGGKQVYLYKGGVAKAQTVVTGTRTSDKIEVVEGLKIGDTLITSGAFQLKPDNPVKIAL